MEVISAATAHEKSGSSNSSVVQNPSSVLGGKSLMGQSNGGIKGAEPASSPIVSSQEKIERIAHALDDYVKSTQRDLQIQVHKGTGNIMVKVISNQDGKVIREIPPEEILNLAAKIDEMAGVLFDSNA